MGNVRGRAIFAAVFAAHAVLFLLLAIGLRPRTIAPQPELVMAPVYLADLRRKPKPQREPAPPTTAARPLPVLSQPAEVADVAPVPAAPPAPPAAAPAVEGEGERQALSRALRGSRVGCANPSLLSDAERERCQDRLEQGSQLAKYIPTPLPPERRAYYDAVVKAKGDMRKAAVVNEHGPAIGCKLAFGGPKGSGGWKKPPHGLKLGPLPCFIMPPVGPLTVEAGIQNPDNVIRDPKKAAGEF